jgi:hypothetical protein
MKIKTVKMTQMKKEIGLMSNKYLLHINQRFLILLQTITQNFLKYHLKLLRLSLLNLEKVLLLKVTQNLRK